MEPLRKRYAIWADEKLISPAQAKGLRKLAISATIVRRQATLLDMMQCLLSSVQAFEEDYVICFLDTCKTVIIVDMMSSSFLAISSRATYLRYNRFGRIIIKYYGVFPILEKVYNDCLALKPLAITHHDDPASISLLRRTISS